MLKLVSLVDFPINGPIFEQLCLNVTLLFEPTTFTADIIMDTFREAPLGQILRWITNNKLLQYPEEKSDFVLPIQYTALLERNAEPKSPLPEPLNSIFDQTAEVESNNLPTPADIESLQAVRTITSVRTVPYGHERFEAEQQLEIQRTKTIPIVPRKTDDGTILVDWYTSDDPANPQNWSSRKKSFVTLLICMYTWVTYLSGSLFVSASPGVEQHFGVSPIAASLGLALFVLAYGVGPLIFGPLTEIPAVGRNPVYVATFVIYWILCFPTATADSFGGLLALRFFGGLFGSAAIGIGGATIGDMLSLIYFPYGLGW